MSDDTTQNGYSVIRSFEFLRTQEFFKKLFDKKNFIIWSDTGTHFRNNQFVNYLFFELKKYEISVEWNLFAEKHGNLNFYQNLCV